MKSLGKRLIFYESAYMCNKPGENQGKYTEFNYTYPHAL
jgi:hypothetical protein